VGGRLSIGCPFFLYTKEGCDFNYAQAGIYKAENNDSIWDSYSVKMHVKETDKAYIFQLIDLDTLYSAAHIEMMFKRSKRFVLKKNRGGHAMRIWSDGDFTIYPYQAGIPYYFKLVEAGAQ